MAWGALEHAPGPWAAISAAHSGECPALEWVDVLCCTPHGPLAGMDSSMGHREAGVSLPVFQESRTLLGLRPLSGWPLTSCPYL